MAYNVPRARLIQFIEDGPGRNYGINTYREVTGGAFPASVVWWDSPAKTKKIYEKVIVRDAGQKPTTVTWRTYRPDGVTVDEEAVDTISYSGPFETSRARTVS